MRFCLTLVRRPVFHSVIVISVLLAAPPSGGQDTTPPAAPAGLTTGQPPPPGGIPPPPPPPPGNLPAWFENATSKRWLALDTQLADVDPCPLSNCSYTGIEGQDAVTEDWTGMAVSPTSAIIAAQGGHGGYGGNEVYVLDLSSGDPKWKMEVPPSTNAPQEAGYYPDGRPGSRHGYAHQTFIPHSEIPGGRWFAPFAAALWGNGNSSSAEAASYRPGSGAYDPRGTFRNHPKGVDGSAAVVRWNSFDNRVWIKDDGNVSVGGLWWFDPATNTYSSQFGGFAIAGGTVVGGAIDPVNNCFVITNGSNQWAFDLDNPSALPVALTPSGTPPSNGVGFVYDPVFGGFLSWNDSGPTVYKLSVPSGTCADTSAWAWSTITNAQGGATPTAAVPAGTYDRFNYISHLHALVLINDVQDNAFIYKLPTSAAGYN